MRGRERELALAPLFICLFLPSGLALCKLGLVRSAFLPAVLTLVLGPSFDLPCLLATAILDSFSLFYLPNTFIYYWFIKERICWHTLFIVFNILIEFTYCVCFRGWEHRLYPVLKAHRVVQVSWVWESFGDFVKVRLKKKYFQTHHQAFWFHLL